MSGNHCMLSLCSIQSTVVVVSVVQRLAPSICHRDPVAVSLIPIHNMGKILVWGVGHKILCLSLVRHIKVNILEDDSHSGYTGCVASHWHWDQVDKSRPSFSWNMSKSAPTFTLETIPALCEHLWISCIPMVVITGQHARLSRRLPVFATGL